MSSIIYGECVGQRQSVPVRISDLAETGCDLEIEDSASWGEHEVSLWIGAVGPFTGTATRKDAGHLAVRFKEPLDGKIVEHFLPV